MLHDWGVIAAAGYIGLLFIVALWRTADADSARPSRHIHLSAVAGDLLHLVDRSVFGRSAEPASNSSRSINGPILGRLLHPAADSQSSSPSRRTSPRSRISISAERAG